MASEAYERLRKDIPLHIRITVAIQAHFIAERGGSFFMPVDETSDEYKEISKINGEACKEAAPIIKETLRVVEEWIEDGMPAKKDKSDELG